MLAGTVSELCNNTGPNHAGARVFMQAWRKAYLGPWEQYWTPGDLERWANNNITYYCNPVV